jgi:acyl-CoA reductase-like NAD-dependent aldehyde dehydrogenase
MFPLSLVCGNTMVMKPSERDPGACMMLVELAKEAGLPDGTVNVIHGKHDCKVASYRHFQWYDAEVRFVLDQHA